MLVKQFRELDKAERTQWRLLELGAFDLVKMLDILAERVALLGAVPPTFFEEEPCKSKSENT